MISYEEALKCFENEQYDDVLEYCTESAKKGEDTKEINMLTIKTLFRILSIDDDTEIIFTILKNAIYCTKTYDERQEVLDEFDWELDDFFTRNKINALILFEEHPTLKNYNSVYMSVMHRTVDLMGERIKAVISVNIQTDEDFDEWEKNYIPNQELKNHKKENEKAVRAQAYISAMKGFENAQILINKCAGLTNSEDIKELCNAYTNSHFAIEIVLSNSYEENEDSEEELATKYEAFIDLYTYSLNLIVFPNERAFSVFNNDSRDQLIEKRNEYINKLLEINPAYEIPELGEYFARPAVSSSGVTTTSSGGCYVATAVYGSYDCPEVWTLRRFRDFTLAKSFFGRLFIRTYYAISPTLVKWFGETKWFKNLWKPTLDKMVTRLNEKGVENTPYDDIVW